MPSAAKTRWSQLKVGIVAVVALVILAFLIITMSGANPLFRKTVPIVVYFDDSLGMTKGATPVSLNGINVGKVSNVEITGESRPNRAVKVTLAINEESLKMIPVDSTASVAQQNLLGSRYINITRGKSKDSVAPGSEIRTIDTTEIQDMLDKGRDTLGALQAILKRVENIVIEIEDGKGTLGKFLRDETLYNNLVTTTDELTKLVVAFNNPNSTLGHIINDDGLYTEVQGTVTDVRSIVGKLDQIMDALNSGQGTAGKFLKDPALYDDVRGAVGDLRETLHMINQGNGTVTKLLKDDTLHVKLEGTLERLNTILDKVGNGDGTMAQLLNNPSLYESADGTMREFQGFMKDFRKNPKKFLTIQLKLF